MGFRPQVEERGVELALGGDEGGLGVLARDVCSGQVAEQVREGSCG
jgi:hypothetical protein